MDGAVVKKGGMVAAGAVVTPGTVVPSGQIFAGNPARLLRAMTAAEQSFGVKSAENYAQLALEHAAENDKSWPEIVADIETRSDLLERDPVRFACPWLDPWTHQDPSLVSPVRAHNPSPGVAGL